MSTRFTEFLVNANGQASRNLSDSIRRVGVGSAGFRDSWNSGRIQDALDTSQEAFEGLDYIQNEILRQREARRTRPGWAGSLVQTALANPVGSIVKPISLSNEQVFVLLPQGSGALPAGASMLPLSLEEALNKLKHRSTVALNFTLPPAGGHLLYALTTAGSGQPATLCEVNMAAFLVACRAVAQHV